MEYITAFSLIAVVLIVSALAAGLVDRAPLSFPMIFLAVGFIVGPLGLGVIAVTPQDPILQTLATLSLALVLFLDAVRLRFDSSSTGWVVPVLDLGPGTIITLVCIALSALVLFGVTPLQALLLGTILSSTDPIVLRDIIRDERLPHSVRQALSIEAGTNDMVILPILFVLLAVMHGRQSGLSDWLTFLGALLIVGPLAGALVGGIGSGLMAVVDARFPVRREYQALYGVGLVLGAYVAGVLAGGDGFLSAFAGGLAVTLLNNELCDCFMDYGEVTAEMAMLLTFVLMGALLSDILGSIVLGPALLFAALVIGVARPLAISVVLHGSPISRAAQAFIAWFGPRGLSSLLFALLAVTNGGPEGDQLLATVGVVVIVSVVLHGASATPMSDWYVGRLAASTHAEERDESLLGVAERDTADVPRIEPEELATRMVETPPPILLDVRSRSDYAHDRSHIPGSVRVLPDMVTVWAARQPKERLVVTYCT